MESTQIGNDFSAYQKQIRSWRRGQNRIKALNVYSVSYSVILFAEIIFDTIYAFYRI